MNIERPTSNVEWKNRYGLFVFSFDVGRSMFDVGRSSFNISFKTTPYGINATCERLQNNLVLMGTKERGGISANLTWHLHFSPFEKRGVGGIFRNLNSASIQEQSKTQGASVA